MWINGNTKIYGIVGNPVSHSLSPTLHNYVYQYYKFDAVYVPFLLSIDQKSDKKLLKSLLKNFNIQGVSVTIPYKNLAFLVADRKDELSQLVRASNTLIKKDHQIYAYNTDGKGALNALYQKTTIKNKNILILGYGGSASAIAGSLLLYDEPNSVIITGRNIQKAKRLVQLLNQTIQHKSKCISMEIKKLKTHISMSDIDIIINTTPLGMKHYPSELPIPEDCILSKHIIMDIVYNPIYTKFLEIAKKKKAEIIEGYWMLLFQAIYQMELFFNIPIEDSLKQKLKKILLKHLQ